MNDALNDLLKAINEVLFLYSTKAKKSEFDEAMQNLINATTIYEANQYVLAIPSSSPSF